MTYADGTRYEGQFKEDKHSRGIITYKNGDTYVGETEDGERNGHGTYTYNNRVIYIGEWKHGKRDGHGTGTFPVGDIYVGEWKDDKIHGIGTVTWPDGRRYDGQCKDNNINGHGTMIDVNGNRYVGYWVNGQRIGRGTMTYVSGNTFVGEWGPSPNGLGLPNGYGIYKTAKYDFEGNWLHDKEHGYIILTTYSDDIKIKKEVVVYQHNVRGRTIQTELGDGTQDEPDAGIDCAICLEPLQDKPVFWLSQCHHAFHRHCLFENVELHNKHTCPMDRSAMNGKNHYSIKRPNKS